MTIRPTVLHLAARIHDVDVSELHDGYRIYDALAASDLAMDLEADLGVEVPDDEVVRWETVGDVVRGMERLKKGEKADAKDRGPLTKRKKKSKAVQGSLL